MAFVANVTIPSLGSGAAYALWGFRASAVGHGDCCVLKRGFDSAFGEAGASALAAVAGLTRLLGSKGGRRISVGEPGCCRVTCDELSVVALLAAAQDGDAARRDAHLRWLMGGRGEDEARAGADAVAAAFRRAGFLIEAPGVEFEAPKARGGLPAFRSFHEAGHA